MILGRDAESFSPHEGDGRGEGGGAAQGAKPTVHRHTGLSVRQDAASDSSPVWVVVLHILLFVYM